MCVVEARRGEEPAKVKALVALGVERFRSRKIVEKGAAACLKFGKRDRAGLFRPEAHDLVQE